MVGRTVGTYHIKFMSGWNIFQCGGVVDSVFGKQSRYACLPDRYKVL